MEMAHRERWDEEIAQMRRLLAGSPMKEERKWGKPTYTVDGGNVVILQGFKDSFALGFFQGALLKDPKKLLVRLGQVQAGRVMKFTSAKETADFPVPEELTARFGKDARFKRAFEALTPGRQRSWLHHFGGAKQSATRAARIDKAAPAILAGRGFLEKP